MLELLLLLLIMGGIVAFIFRSGRGGSIKSEGGGFSLGHAKLTCPHCNQETTAGKPQCEHCGEDL